MACCIAVDKSPRKSNLPGSPRNEGIDEPFLHENKSFSDDTHSLDSEKRSGPTGGNFPTWMKDDETDFCMGCDSKFTFRDRKHHCRRCRSIFCKNCTLNNSKILLYSISEDVRVCDACYHLLPEENRYVQELRPMLHRSNMFKKSIRMGLTTKVVTLRMMSDDKTLVYDDDTRAEPTVINLNEVERINVTTLKAFELFTDSKSFQFIADNQDVQKAWVEALKIAIKNAREPPLREKVNIARKKRVELRKRTEYENQRQDAIIHDRDAQRSERTNIRGKYGLS